MIHRQMELISKDPVIPDHPMYRKSTINSINIPVHRQEPILLILSYWEKGFPQSLGPFHETQILIPMQVVKATVPPNLHQAVLFKYYFSINHRKTIHPTLWFISQPRMWTMRVGRFPVLWNNTTPQQTNHQWHRIRDILDVEHNGILRSVNYKEQSIMQHHQRWDILPRSR